jgi:hypothetical protein
MCGASLAKTPVLLLLFVLGAVPISAAGDSPVPDSPWLKPPRSTVEARPHASGEPGRQVPRVATDKMEDPGTEDPGYCGDGACDYNEEWCTNDCGEPPPPPPPPQNDCSGMNWQSIPLMSKTLTAPTPASGGNCNCVVRVDTTDRVVRGVDLVQECSGHWGHGHCPECGFLTDAPHDAPIGIWGVQLSLDTHTVTSPLAGAYATEPSQAQDGPQWPSNLDGYDRNGHHHKGDWNSCTCDTQHLDTNPGDSHEYFKPNETAPASALAGWFKVLSNSQTCESLASQPLIVGFTLFLWELDPGLLSGTDDYITSLTSRQNNFGSLSCTPDTGVCEGSVENIPFAGFVKGPSPSVQATGKVSVECRSRPWQEGGEDDDYSWATCNSVCAEHDMICLGGRCSMSPVLIDVQGNGFNLTDTNSGVEFDLNADGLPERVSWTAILSDDGFLTLDLNGNGVVDDGRELFGSVSPQPEPPGGVIRNGFNALIPYDSPENGGNSDGVIDARDTIFTSLRLWQDANHNGTSEADELHALLALGLKSMDLKYKESKRVDEHGNHFRYRAKVDDVHGAHVKRWAWDVFLLIQD